MITKDFIIHLFWLMDDRMGKVDKPRQAIIYPRENVTVGLMFSLKSGDFRCERILVETMLMLVTRVYRMKHIVYSKL